MNSLNEVTPCRTSASAVARDTAQSGYTPFMEGSTPTLGIQTPVYRGGVTPPTVAARRAAFLGWLAESLVPKRVLRAALQGHPHVAVKFRYHVAGSDVTFTSGVAPAGAPAASISATSAMAARQDAERGTRNTCNGESRSRDPPLYRKAMAAEDQRQIGRNLSFRRAAVRETTRRGNARITRLS